MTTDSVVLSSHKTSGVRWQSRALCADKTHLFFEPPGERGGRRARREAIALSYCAACPVANRCRQEGRINREHGIWGGETDEQRARAGYPPRSPSRRGVAAAAREGASATSGRATDPLRGQLARWVAMPVVRNDEPVNGDDDDESSDLALAPRTEPSLDSWVRT